MKSTNHLRKFTNFVHYDKLHNSLPFILLNIIVFLDLFNFCMVIVYEEKNMEKRFKAINIFACTLFLFTCVLKRGFNPENALEMISLIEGDLVGRRRELNRVLAGVDRKSIWDKISDNYERRKQSMEELYKKMYTITIGSYISIIFRTVSEELMEKKIGSENIFEDWPTPFVYWCPAGYDGLPFFICMELLHCIMLYFMVAEMFCNFLTTCLATERVLADFESIYIMLDSLSEIYPEMIVFYGNDDLLNTSSSRDDMKMMIHLKNDMTALIKCHQDLNRNFKTCAEYSAYSSVVLTSIIYADTVQNIYSVLKNNNVTIMVNFAIACICVNLIILFCYHNGQKIVNQNDLFRRHLAQVPWINKPKWFKSSLCIMMRRANIDTELKPYNIYVLNHESFKNILKAAFSFGNIFYSVKSKYTV